MARRAAKAGATPASGEGPGSGDGVRLADMTGHLLRRAENCADAWYYKVIGETEVTPRQFAVLLTLYREGHMTQSELAAKTAIDRSTLNEMMRRLVERGFVSRRVPAENRRTKEIWLSPQGQAALREILPRAALSQRLMLESLPREYRRIFVHCLEMLVEAFPSQGDEAGGGPGVPAAP